MVKNLLDHFDIHTKEKYLFCLTCISLYMLIVSLSVLLTIIVNYIFSLTLKLYVLPLFISGAILLYNLKLGFHEITDCFGRKLVEVQPERTTIYNSFNDCKHRLTQLEIHRLTSIKEDHKHCTTDSDDGKYLFVQGPIGIGISYVCACGEKIDITDYNSW